MGLLDLESSPQRVLLRDVARERIRDAILDGTLLPGEVLHNDELMEWLGVSRTPLREAINELVRMGLIEMAANKYTRVVDPSVEEAPSATRTFGVLLSGAVRLSVGQLDSAAREAIAAGLDELARASGTGDLTAVTASAMPTFSRYVAGAGNPSLLSLWNDAAPGLVFRIRAGLAESFDPERTSAQLRTLREATLAGDARAAQDALEQLCGFPEPEQAARR